MLYIGWGQVVEAIGAGVVMRTLSDALQEATLAVAYRHPDLEDSTALQIRDFVGSKLGRAYNYVGVAQQGINKYCWLTGQVACGLTTGNVSFKHDTFFCIVLIWAAYSDVGIKLSNTAPHWSQPGDVPKLALKKALSYVGHLKA
jgi:uncharacterized protein YycO